MIRSLAHCAPIAIAAIPVAATAQRVWVSRDSVPTVALESFTALFRDENTSIDHALFGTAIARISAGGGAFVTFELPFAYAVGTETGTFETRPAATSATRVGNPWIGVILAPRANSRTQLGFRLGVQNARHPASNPGLLGGSVVDFDRSEAWDPEMSTLRLLTELGPIPLQGVFINGRLGASALIPFGAGLPSAIRSTLFYGDYGARIGYATTGVLTSVALSGRVAVFGPDGVSEFHPQHQLSMTVEASKGAVRPWIEVRRPFARVYTQFYDVAIAGGVVVSR